MALAEGRHVAVDGGAVYCEIVGAGRPIVFSHDGMLHRESWDAQVAGLAHGYRVSRWDRRGYGRSADPTTGYSSVDDLTSVIEQTCDSPAVLIGCSYGSLVSLHCALERPDLVSALVLVGPIVSGLGFTEHFATRGGLYRLDEAAAEQAQIEYWSTVDRWLIAASNTEARVRLRELLTANPHNLAPKRRWQQSPAPDALPRLGQITAPTLIVVGACDIPDVQAHAGALEAGIRGARRVVIGGSGHLPQLETPDSFNQVVLEFLATLP